MTRADVDEEQLARRVGLSDAAVQSGIYWLCQWLDADFTPANAIGHSSFLQFHLQIQGLLVVCFR